ncbi:retrovirus-related pol polyprotein from transposon TNT 1-94, partial [Tanacetum coccineum]
MNHQTSTVPQVIPQVAYQSPQAHTQPMTKSPFGDSGFVVPKFSPGDDPIACLNKAMAFLTAVASSRAMLLVHGEILQVDMQELLNATTAKYKEKAMLAEAREARQILDEEQLAFLADPGIPSDQAQTIIPYTAAFQTEDLDTYDSDCDDLLTAQAVLMANISNYGSDIISEEENVNHDKWEIEPINKELENSVAKLLSKNESLCNEINHVKRVFKDQFNSIKQTRVRHKEQSDSLINKVNLKSIEIEDLKAQIQDKLDLESLPPRLLQNREVHIDYLRNTQEQANILWKIVEQAKAKQPLDGELDLACLLNLSHTQATGNRSKPPRNKMNDRISQTPSRNKKNKVEAQPRKVNKMNRVVKPVCDVDVKHSLSKMNFEILCATCNKSMFDGVHDKCLLDLAQNGNKRNHSQLMNFVSKFLGTLRFENDQIARIIGYGDYHLGNVIISRVYYVEGFEHNLFYVGQFCDADLEVVFRKNTCFIRNLEGVDLLLGSRDTNLYTIYLDDMLKSSLICLLSKASKTKSWLWHRRLSHLNFGTLNKLAKDGLARGIPRLKFQKDHLCLACALGKSKKSSHQPKAEDTNQEKLYLLHMDLCGLMRVASINGKRYILVIVDDYSRFTWVRFLKTKDEALVAIIKCIKNIQVRLKATVQNVRTYNGTEFVNQRLHEWYENVGITHQTSVARTPQQNDVVE